MSRFSRIALLAAFAAIAVSCARTAKIDAVISDAQSSEIIVRLLDINRFRTLDTLAVSGDGKVSYKVEIEKGQPEFIYLFHGDRKIASLILEAGDRVSVVADTVGNYTVEGSEESRRLSEVERDFAAAAAKMNSLLLAIENTSDPSQAASLRQEVAQEYVRYYRDRVKYVMGNSRSLSVVPVFYQTFGSNLPVFSQNTDGIHFRNVADSLALAYPESKYVKALRQEAQKRLDYLELENRLRNAGQVGFPDMELPDIAGQKQKLSEIDSKVVLVHFWTASDAGQKMFILDTLSPLYEEFHDRGLEMYLVSLDVDKGLWAQVVRQQKHPWISVCDSRGASSPYALSYNLRALPATYVIADGVLVDGSANDSASLRRLIRRHMSTAR